MSAQAGHDSVTRATIRGESTAQNAEIVAEIYAAVGRGDIPGVLDLLAEEVVWTVQGPAAIPFAGTFHGRDGVATFLRRVGETLSFEQFEPHTVIAQGTTVVVLGSERSHAHGSGLTVAMEWAHVYTLGNGRITAFRAFEDTAALVAAIAPA